jgi:hypothetical protein
MFMEAGDPADSFSPPVPDFVDLVTESAAMVTIHAAERLMRIDAMRRDALRDAERHGRGLIEVVERSIRLELATALRITEYAAGALLALGEALVHRYPEVLESFSHADMTEQHASFIVESLDAIEPEFRARVMARAIELAETEPVGTFRRRLRALIDTVRAETLTQRHEAAVTHRRVTAETAEDGMAWLHAYMPAVDVHAIIGRATAIAKVIGAQEGETRSLDQIRSDVLADLLIDGNTPTHPEQARGIRASVAVTVPVLALLDPGARDAGETAVVEGVGPIPIQRARELCGGDGEWMRVLTHPETGMVLSVGRDQYRPPAALRRLVRWRADRCMAPGCGVPASRCEIDHSIAWEHGGTTCLNNLCPLCKGHHIVKHHGGWSVRLRDDGSLEWTSPTGRQTIVRPERTVPVFRPATPEGDPPF